MSQTTLDNSEFLIESTKMMRRLTDSQNYVVDKIDVIDEKLVKVDELETTVEGFDGRITNAQNTADTVASTENLGRVKVDGTSIGASDAGVISASMPVATNSVAGKVKPDNSSITIANDGTISAVGAVPVGTIIWSANATVPSGYLLCNGSAVGRTTYPELFTAIGTTFGTGDGSTTFNLPNLIGKFVEGSATAGTVHAAGLPNITGDMAWVYGSNFSGAFSKGTTSSSSPAGGSTSNGWSHLVLNASNSNSIYGNSTTVQPPSVTCLPCIKAFSSVVGDSTVVASNLANDIESKVALDGSNLSSATFKVIVETGKSDSLWYRKWSDGFIEQGGSFSYNSSSANTSAPITFPTAFSGTDYTIIVYSFNSTASSGHCVVSGKTRTGATFVQPANVPYASWFACGF